MFLIPPHYFKPSGSSLSDFWYLPGIFHMSSQMWHLPLCSSPAGVLRGHVCTEDPLSGMLCEPCFHGHCPWYQLRSRVWMAMLRALSSTIPKATWCLPFLALLVSCYGTWKAGASAAPNVCRDPLSRLSWALGSCQDHSALTSLLSWSGHYSVQGFSALPAIKITWGTWENINVWMCPEVLV